MQKNIKLSGMVKSPVGTVALNLLSVELHSEHAGNKAPIARARVGRSGKFEYKLNSATVKRHFSGAEQVGYFVVRANKAVLRSTLDEILVPLEKDQSDITIELTESAIDSIRTDKNPLPETDLRKLLAASGVPRSKLAATEAKLKRSGLASLQQIVSRLDRVTVGRTGLDQKQTDKFKSYARIFAASGSNKITNALLDQRHVTFSGIGGVSIDALQNQLGLDSKADKVAIRMLHDRATRIRGDVFNQIAFDARLHSRDGRWLIDPDRFKSINLPELCHCEDCQNVFGPFSYLVSLLDMIHDHWFVSTHVLSTILGQDIDGLDCQKSKECLLQIELALEVLETDSRCRFPITNSKLSKDTEEIWLNLFFGQSTRNHRSAFLALATSGTDRTRKLMEQLLNPGKGLDSIRNVLKEIKRESRNRDLKNLSEFYAKGGEAFDEAAEEAYQKVIVLYRSVLIEHIGLSEEKLQETYFIDLKAAPCHKTNRLTFLIRALQSFVLAVRTGSVAKYSRPDLNPNFRNTIRNLSSIPIEEANWKWLKDYYSWASAMYVYLYPENVALPFLSKQTGEEFSEYIGSFLGNTVGRIDIFKLIYRYYFDERSREFIREDQANINPEPYLVFLRPIIEAGENYFDAAQMPVEKFIYNLNSLIRHYENYYIGDWGSDGFELIPYNKTTTYGDLNSLYFPLLAGFALNKSEQFASAHDWYRLIYDPAKEGQERFGFDFHGRFDGSELLGEEWNNGTLDPNEIVHRRESAMLRSVILAMAKNLIDWADHEFALATATTLDRARDLYEQARIILNSPDLSDHCRQTIRNLTIEIVTRYGLDPADAAGTAVDSIEVLELIDDPAIIEQADNDIRGVLPDPGNIDPPKVQEIEKIVRQAVQKYRATTKSISVTDHATARAQQIVATEDFILRHSAESSTTGISPYFFAPANRGVFLGTEGVYTDRSSPSINPYHFCVPANPMLVYLDAKISLSLLKFQLCLDITGEPLPTIVVDENSVAEFFDRVDVELDSAPLLDLPNNWFNQPPRYRYSYLAEKARQYTEIAQRMGALLLNAHEKRDSEHFAVLNAKNAIEISSSTIDLKNLSLKDAITGLEIADLQSRRAETQLEFWQKRIDEGMLSEKEHMGIFLMNFSAWLNVAAGVIQGVGAIAAFFGAGAAGTGGGAAAGTVAPGAGNAAGGTAGAAAGFSLGAALAAAVPGTASALGSFAGALNTFGSVNLTLASFERRFEDWTLSRDISEYDLSISDAQKTSANNRMEIANQELSISKLQNTHAKEVLEFLENKYSNEHLYQWMTQILSQNYRSLMQLSSGAARLAQRSLEFERQESINIISGDYWSISADTGSANLSAQQKSSGLLGAERLLTDITRLDAYRLGTEIRRLELTKSISLAQMLPTEMAELRANGIATFNTLMHWFDRDFPGHYLRLIKGVKLSILALTPPVDGIHGTLANTGESTVVVKDGVTFKPIRAFRDFGEEIALDSPFNETGLFVFNYTDPMFLPFEGLGVETQWTLSLPKGSNRFDFDTLVDVMLTIDYTAFSDPSYAEQVNTSLGDKESNDLSFNIRLQYPDSWYHLKNPANASATTQEISFVLESETLPHQYDLSQIVSTNHVSIVISGDFSSLSTTQLGHVKRAIKIEHQYTQGNSTDTIVLTSAAAVSAGESRFETIVHEDTGNYILFSSRKANDLSSSIGNGVNPVGDWTVSIQNTDLGFGKSLSDVIEDLIVVVTTEGLRF